MLHIIHFSFPPLAKSSQEDESSRVEEIQKRLAEIHGGTFAQAEYFLWAETIVSDLK